MSKSEHKSISEWQNAVHQNAKDHGWWDGIEEKSPWVIPEKLCLIHSETSEALEVYRESGKILDAGYGISKSIYDDEGTVTDSSHRNGVPRKPIGLDSELADIVIRVMDLCGHLGIDLEKAIREKHEFNVTRPFKHGGKRC